jgi:hypothetical protein
MFRLNFWSGTIPGRRSFLAINPFLKSRQGLSSDRDGNQSESELWLRTASDLDTGNVSAFEDEFGNQLRPTGQLTDAFPLRTNKQRALITKVPLSLGFHKINWFSRRKNGN